MNADKSNAEVAEFAEFFSACSAISAFKYQGNTSSAFRLTPSITRPGFLQIFLDLFSHFAYFDVEFAFGGGYGIAGQDAADRFDLADDLLAEARYVIRERMLVIIPAINPVIRSNAHINILGETGRRKKHREFSDLSALPHRLARSECLEKPNYAECA